MEELAIVRAEYAPPDVCVKEAKPAKIFDALESINLALPFLFFGLVALQLLTQSRVMETHNDLVRVAKNILFLNGVHTIFTPLWLFGLPEGRALLRAHWRQRSAWVFGALSLLVIVPLLTWATQHYPRQRNVTEAFWLVLYFIYAVHGLRQIYGLSLTYNKVALQQLDGSARATAQALECKERFYFMMLLTLFVAKLFVTKQTFPLYSLRLGELLTVLCFLPVAGLLHTAYAYRGYVWRNKQLFLWRTLLFPLTFFTPVAGASHGALHGFEYFSFTMAMSNRSSQEARKRLHLLYAIGSVFMVLIYFSSPPYFLFAQETGWRSTVGEFVILVSTTIQFLHYFVDAFVFRLKDPLTRQHISPLLNSYAGEGAVVGTKSGPSELRIKGL